MDQERFQDEEVVASGFISGLVTVALGVFHSRWWFLAAAVAFLVGARALIRLRRRNALVSPRFGRRRGHGDAQTEEGPFSSGLQPVNHGTLEQAVRHASSGKQILVEPGEYYEHLMVTKPLSIVGEGPREEIRIHAEGTWMFMCEETVTLRGITLSGSEEAVTMLEASEGTLVLEDCIVEGRIDIEKNRTRAEIRNCLFRGEHSSAQFSKGARGTVESCTFEVVRGPVLTVCQGGVVEIEGCTITVDDYSSAVDVRDHARAELRDSHISGAGIDVSRASEVSVSQCRVESGWASGVSVTEQSTVDIRDSTVSDNTAHGIKVEDAQVELTECDIVNNGRFGVYAATTARGSIQDCNVTDNAEGAFEFSEDSAMEIDPIRE